MLEKIYIEKASLKDLDIIANIEKECFPIKEAASKESIKKRIEAFSDSFLVAKLDDKIIAFVNGAIVNNDKITDEMYENTSLHNEKNRYQAIFGLDVLESYRNKGLARKLLSTLLEEAKLRGQKGAILTCKEHLIDYYSSFGFVNKGISASTHGGVTWYDMKLEF